MTYAIQTHTEKQFSHMNSFITPNGTCESYAKKLNNEAGKMAQWVKKLAEKTDDLGPILRNHMTEGEN